jgi:hypothetical protein
MLKKILFAVPLIYGGHSLRFDKENGGTDCLKKLEGCETCKEHYKSDKQRVNDKFIVLRSMVPSISEVIKLPLLEIFVIIETSIIIGVFIILYTCVTVRNCNTFLESWKPISNF